MSQQSAKKSLQIGARMRDGTILAGISPDTGKPMYATPYDTTLTMKWRQANEYAANLDAYGHKDWRVPTPGELNVLFQNRAAIQGFNLTGKYPEGSYWSTYPDGNHTLQQSFRDGDTTKNLLKFGRSSVRLVR
jgi:hypothetical protein